MRHTNIRVPAELEEAYPFADGESAEAAIARHGDVCSASGWRASHAS